MNRECGSYLAAWNNIAGGFLFKWQFVAKICIMVFHLYRVSRATLYAIHYYSFSLLHCESL